MTPLAPRHIDYWRFEMNWKKIAGRALTVVVAAALLVFAITGTVPSWWEGTLGVVATVASILIGEWKPPV